MLDEKAIAKRLTECERALQLLQRPLWIIIRDISIEGIFIYPQELYFDYFEVRHYGVVMVDINRRQEHYATVNFLTSKEEAEAKCDELRESLGLKKGIWQ